MHETDLANKETIEEKVKRRNDQAHIILQILELAKKLKGIHTNTLASKIRFPDYLGESAENELREELDRRYWREILQDNQVEKLLTTEDFEKLEEKFEEKCPVFNEENVSATIATFRNSEDATASKLIKKVYKSFTDANFRVGNKYNSKAEKRYQKEVPKTVRLSIFYSYNEGLPSYVSSNSRFHLINDLERAMYLCDEGIQPDRKDSIEYILNNALHKNLDECENKYFHLKVFKNGNVKLSFKDLKTLEKFNAWGRKENTLE